MLLVKLRVWVQAISFLILTYGGRFGVNLGNALPCFSCPFVSGCGGYCFIFVLQRMGTFGLAMTSTLFTAYWFKTMFAFLAFAMWAILFSKLWCGWICPFGTVQDGLTFIRKKMGLPELEMPWYVRDAIKPVKYFFLAIILIVPLLIAYAGFSRELNLLFCYICPARVIMPLFIGRVGNFALDYSNYTTLIITVISAIFAGVTIAGSFFKERFFCLVCPMLPLIQIFKKITPLRFVKKGHYCNGCGNCQRVCPMDIRDVHEQEQDANVMTEDCILCGSCTNSCPVDGALEIKLFKWTIYRSSKKNVWGRLLKKNGK